MTLVDGGEAVYLGRWIRESGLADLRLRSLPETVWVGVSAGSMAMTPGIGARVVQWPSAQDDRTLRVLDFPIFPQLDVFPRAPWPRRSAGRPRSAAAYAVDDQTATKAADGTVEVVSEGRRGQFP